MHEFKNGKTWGKAGMYFAFIYLAIIVYSFITVIFRIDQTSANQDSIDQMTYFAPLMSGIYVCLLAPLFEEIVFRFGIYRSLCKINEKMALLIVALTGVETTLYSVFIGSLSVSICKFESTLF